MLISSNLNTLQFDLLDNSIHTTDINGSNNNTFLL